MLDLRTLDSPTEGSGFHVGLIGDGVRRWARSNGVPLAEAYLAAIPSVAAFVDFFYENGADALSIYMLSKENLSRPPSDFEAASHGETEFFRTLLRDLVAKWRCEVRLAGDADLLPRDYLAAIRELQALPSNEERRLYLLAGYSPIDELLTAARQGVDGLLSRLWVPEPVDLVLRTSGERRISNFLPLQAGYAELQFFDKFINDLTRADCEDALASFRGRSRRYGH